MNIIKISPDLYEIPLPKGSIYKRLRWVTDLDTSKSSYTVVEAPLSKFIALCKDPHIPMVRSASEWPGDMREEYIKGQDPKKRFAMPRIGFCERDVRRGILDILSFKPSTIWAVGFANGRHRVRIAEYLGAQYIPVQLPNTQVKDFQYHLSI